jgi:hypothetical protein
VWHPTEIKWLACQTLLSALHGAKGLFPTVSNRLRAGDALGPHESTLGMAARSASGSLRAKAGLPEE